MQAGRLRSVSASPSFSLSPRPFTPSSSLIPNSTFSSATSPAPAAPQSFSDIVNRFGGWYPLVGAAAAIAVTKEVLVVNEELLLATNFVAAVVGIYVVAGDTLAQSMTEEIDALFAKERVAWQVGVEMTKNQLKYYGIQPLVVEMWKTKKAAYNANIRAVAAAQATKAKLAAAQSMLKRLSDIRTRENSEKGAAVNALITGASTYVRSNIGSLSEKDRSQILENALDILSGKVTQIDIARDPVKRLYLDYLKQAKLTKQA